MTRKTRRNPKWPFDRPENIVAVSLDPADQLKRLLEGKHCLGQLCRRKLHQIRQPEACSFCGMVAEYLDEQIPAYETAIAEAEAFHDQLVILYRDAWAARDAGKPRLINGHQSLALYSEALAWQSRMVDIARSRTADEDLCDMATMASRAFMLSQYLGSIARWIVGPALSARKDPASPLLLAEHRAKHHAA